MKTHRDRARRRPLRILCWLSGAISIIFLSACTTRQDTALAVDTKTASAAIAEIPFESTLEEQRVDAALTAMNKHQRAMITEMQFATLAHEAMRAKSSVARNSLLQQAASAGGKLWTQATQDAQQLNNQPLDDRPLYWRRLLEKREFRRRCSKPTLCNEMLSLFERASRGASDLELTTDTHQDALRIVVSGFDPFALDDHIDQSNPSGAAALALDNLRLSSAGVHAEIQSVLFPVRFADFDEGMVEEIFEPLITSNAIDMLITISMGRTGFDLERYPGRRRSATAPDNLGVRSGASATNPLIPLLAGDALDGPEFVEFSLPVNALKSVQTPYPVNDNRQVVTLEEGAQEAVSLASLNNQTAVRGSGGGYLSNEISYRTVRLVRLHNSTVAVGHIHTPRISAFDEGALRTISKQIQAMLRAAIAAHKHP